MQINSSTHPAVKAVAELYPALMHSKVRLPSSIAGALVADPNAYNRVLVRDYEINGPGFYAYIAEQDGAENDVVTCFKYDSVGFEQYFSLEFEGDVQSFVDWANNVTATFSVKQAWTLAEQLAEAYYTKGEERTLEAFKKTLTVMTGRLPATGYPMSERLRAELFPPRTPHNVIKLPVSASR